MAAKKEFDVLLFWALDRLSREGSRKTIARLQAFDDAGVKWHSFTEQYLTSMGPFADAIISLLAVLANQEKLRISERTKAGLARVRDGGQRLGRPCTISQHVVEIMREKRAAGVTCRAMAKEFSVSYGRISQLTKGARVKEP
jgi:putative DNA-invertase from lambdoid prophage Rac